MPKVILPVVRQCDIQPDPRHLRRNFFRLAKIREGRLPLFPPHVDHAQVRVGCRCLRIEGEDLPKAALRAIEIPLPKCCFAPREDLLGIRTRLRGTPRALCRRAGLLIGCALRDLLRSGKNTGRSRRDQNDSDS